MKKILTLVVAAALSASTLSAKTTKSAYDLSYDVSNGWYWYEEKVIDSETKKEKTVKFKMSPKEKREMDDKKKMISLLEKQIEKQDKILARLDYAFPNVTPIYTTNKKTGEKCLTNSSMNCFVMPVVAEGQQIPALKDFLRKPSPENSKNWLQWQATYFNHVQKVSHGLRFAYLKGGADAYPTSTSFSRGDSLVLSQAEKVAAHREAKVIHSLKEKIGLVVFVGKNTLFEKSNKNYRQVHNWNKSFLKDIDKVFAFKSEKSRRDFFNIVKEQTAKSGEKSIYEFWRTAKTVVNENLYKQYRITMTPTILMSYVKENKELETQVILSGTLSSEFLRKQMKNFLTYNEIIEEKAFAAESNWESPEIQYKTSIPKPNESKIFDSKEK